MKFKQPRKENGSIPTEDRAEQRHEEGRTQAARQVAGKREHTVVSRLSGNTKLEVIEIRSWANTK